jgi:hypothetical protein
VELEILFSNPFLFIIYLFLYLCFFYFSNGFQFSSSPNSAYRREPRELTRYSDRIRVVRSRGRSSSPGRVKNFLFYKPSIPNLGPTQTLIQWVSSSLSPGLKRARSEFNHSPPTSSEVKKSWICTSTPPYVFKA